MKVKKKESPTRLLANIQVLVDDLAKRDWSRIIFMFNSNIHPGVYLDGIANESEILEGEYRKAKKAISKGNFIEANRHTSEFALAAKNLADNLNSYMQVLYTDESSSDWKIKLSDLEKNTLSAPRTYDNRTLAQVFQETHDFGKKNLVKVLRDKKGHGNGHLSLDFDKRVPSGYKIKFGITPVDYLNGLKEFGLIDSVTWLNNNVNSYLEMAKTCLQTISDKKNHKFFIESASRKKRKNVYVQMYKNWNGRNKKQVQIALATGLFVAGIMGGVLGTSTYQTYQEKAKFQRSAAEASYVLDVENGVRSYYDNWERVVSKDIKRKILNQRAEEISKIFGENALNPAFKKNLK